MITHRIPRIFFIMLALLVGGTSFGGVLKVVLADSSETGLSESIFPETLEGLPLVGILEADQETALGFNVPIEKGYKAIYKNEVRLIYVNILEGENVSSTLERVDWILPESLSMIEDEYGDVVDFTPLEYTYVSDYMCPIVGYEVDLGSDEINGLMLVLGADIYMIMVHIMSGVDEPQLAQIEDIAEYFLDKIPHQSTPSPSITQTTPTEHPERQVMLEKIDETELAVLNAVLWHPESYYYSAVKSKLRFSFLLGQILVFAVDDYAPTVQKVKDSLPSDLYEKLSFGNDLEEILRLLYYCKQDRFDEFATEYEEYAEKQVMAEFGFEKAQDRIVNGFEDLRVKVTNGQMDEYAERFGEILNLVQDGIPETRSDFAYSTELSDEAADRIIGSIRSIEKLTGYAGNWLGAQLAKVKIASTMSLVWAQDQIRYWTVTAYLWGGTEKMKDNIIGTLSEQYGLFEYVDFYYGPVYIIEDGIETELEDW